MVAEATFLRPANEYRHTAVATLEAGDVVQLPNGRAAVRTGLNDVDAGERAGLDDMGCYTIAAATGIVLLDGQGIWWDWSARKATYKPVNDRDFYLGTAVGDKASAEASVVVCLNRKPAYAYDMAVDASLSVATGTAAAGGFGLPNVFGGARQLQLTGTSEAQAVDILSVDRRAIAAGLIFEAVIRPVANGSGSTVDFSIGLANGTSTTDADAITEHVLFHIDGGSTAINAQSKDGTTTVTATDTTKTISAGSAVANRTYLAIDARDPTSVKLYVDGVRVLSSTTFRLDNGTGPLGALAHIEKTSATTTGNFLVDFMGLRTSGE